MAVLAATPLTITESAARPSLKPGACPSLSIVIVNYRSWPATERLIRSLSRSQALQSGHAEIVVVDNGSPPSPARRRLRRLPGVSLRCWKRNHGFARAVNEGCRLARGDWFLLLNPDTAVEPATVDHALEMLAVQTPATGIIGLRLRDADGACQPSTGDVPNMLSIALGLARPRAERRCRRRDRSQEHRPGWVTGCGMLIQRACFTQIGGFDPAYFLYYEDVDLCVRARRAGWTVRHTPDLAIGHYHPLHSRRVSPLLRLLTRHSLLTFARKHWPAWQTTLLAIVIWCEAWWLGRTAPGRGLHRTQQRMAWNVMLGYSRRAYRYVARAAQRARPKNEPTNAGRLAHGVRLKPR